MPSLRQTLVAAMARRYPFYTGCGWLANHRIIRRLAGPSKEIAWARVQGGYLVAAPLDDHVGRAIFYVGELDRKITWVCSRLVRPGDTVLDIGANLGMVSLILSAMVGPSGQVHAFEPNPDMQSLMGDAITRNRIHNVILHPIALGSQAGEVMLSVPRGNAGAASVVAARGLSESVDIPVQMRTLSAVMAEHDVDQIRLVKIDVEGFESEVLIGAIGLFSRVRPDAIIFEVNDLEGDVRHHPTFRLLSRSGYGFFSLPRRLLRMQAYRFDLEHPGEGRGTALLARRGGRPGQNHGWGHDFVAAPLGPIYEEVAWRLGAVYPPHRLGEDSQAVDHGVGGAVAASAKRLGR
jgi:FkbM family methyltransferase